MSSNLEDSQALRDAQRAAGDLARALRIGATLTDLDELITAKAKADERVRSLRRRTEPVEPQRAGHGPRWSAADLLERRQRRREALRAEMDD
ncbi:MAG TPA: hypothetical protein VGL75_10935 [Acidothermaceae bacterium]|jgi:hypothetical protein